MRARLAAAVGAGALGLALAGMLAAQDTPPAAGTDAPAAPPAEALAVPATPEPAPEATPPSAAEDVPADAPVDGPLDAAGETGAPAPAAGSETPEAVVPETLASMRADLAALGAALQTLRAELVAAGPAGFEAAGGTAAIARMDAMEAEISRLNAAVETLRKQVEETIAEAANRAGDIEFRLCELDPNCDLGALTTAQMQAVGAADLSLGDTADADGAVAMPQPATVAEGAEFDAASAALNGGDYARAAELFGAFAEAHATSPLAPEALYLRGEAFAAAGRSAEAGRAWLAAFSLAPTGPRAGASLLGVAQVVAVQGRTEEACGFLDQVVTRFPATPVALEAVTLAEGMACPGGAPAGDETGGEGGESGEAPAATDPEAAGDLVDGG